jgi:hypothetical protein
MKTISNEIKSGTKEDYMVYGNRGCPKFNIWALSDKLFNMMILLFYLLVIKRIIWFYFPHVQFWTHLIITKIKSKASYFLGYHRLFPYGFRGIS